MLQHDINVMDLMQPLDIFVFVAVLLLTVGSVVYGHRRKQSIAENGMDSFLDHFLMGRHLTLPLFVGTLVATWYGGIFGVTKIAFDSGIYMFVTQGFFWYLSYVLFALFIVPKVQGSGAITLPELVGQMFGKRASYVAAVFNLFNVIPIAYALSLGIFLNLVFGLSVSVGTLLGTLTVCLYSCFGGFRAVVFSDMVQFFTMCSSVFLVLALSISQFGGVSFLQANLPASYFDPTGGYSLATTLVWGFIALSTLVDPNFYQRCFAASSKQTARRGILISTVIWCGFDLCTTFGSMYARALIPEADGHHAYMTYALQVLPSGLRGFFIAGILCTVLSTLDSYMFVASNTLSYDLAPRKWRHSIALSNAGTILVGLIACGMSLLFEGSIKDVWKTLGSYSAGCLLLPVALGYVFPQKVGERGFLLGCLGGVVAITYWRFAELSGFWADIDDLYVGVVFSLLGVILGAVWDGRTKEAIA